MAAGFGRWQLAARLARHFVLGGVRLTEHIKCSSARIPGSIACSFSYNSASNMSKRKISDSTCKHNDDTGSVKREAKARKIDSSESDSHSASAIFIFRRDLRLCDNLGLLDVAKAVAAKGDNRPVLGVFFLDDRQVKREKNEYSGERSVQFMMESLADLDRELAERGGGLLVVRGQPECEIPGLIRKYKAAVVGWNGDVTPFSRDRDAAVQKAVEKEGAEVLVHTHDTTLANIWDLRTGTGNCYLVFTPFSKRVHGMTIPRPCPLPSAVRFLGNHSQSGDDDDVVKLPPSTGRHAAERKGSSDTKDVKYPSRDVPPPGGRASAKQLLRSVPTRCARYAEERDFPALDATSRLSPYLKFGCVSVREVYWEIESMKSNHRFALRNELIWHDFYEYVSLHNPHVFKGNLKPMSVKWRDDPNELRKWEEGMTGFPLVDAGMRQLRATGWMHNRVRMVVASFLTKDLLISWRTGERVFAQMLVDYDPSSNNGGWQWAAGTGADAMPYFRIFNPWTQGKKFDPDGKYIKYWVPELKNVPAKELHKADGKRGGSYPKPMVDHAYARDRTLKAFRAKDD